MTTTTVITVEEFSYLFEKARTLLLGLRILGSGLFGLFGNGSLSGLLAFFCHNRPSLFAFLVKSVFPTEPAVLIHLKSIGVILLILFGLIVPLLALAANQSNLNPHFGTSCKFGKIQSFLPPSRALPTPKCVQKKDLATEVRLL